MSHVDVKKLGNIPDGGGWRFVGASKATGTGSLPPTSPTTSTTARRWGSAFVHT
jgi:hypothetical protein